MGESHPDAELIHYYATLYECQKCKGEDIAFPCCLLYGAEFRVAVNAILL